MNQARQDFEAGVRKFKDYQLKYPVRHFWFHGKNEPIPATSCTKQVHWSTSDGIHFYSARS